MTTNPLRKDFPVFAANSTAENNAAPHQPWIYFDNAATSQKPQSVIDAISDFYIYGNANVHRASHSVAATTTAKFEGTRAKVKSFINAPSTEQVVFTKGATEAINLVAYCLSQRFFKAGDRMLLSTTEHHANIVPWQRVAEKMGMHIDVVPLLPDGTWDVENALDLITEKTVLVSLGHVSNALGNINPISAIVDKGKQVGALSLIDGAQAAAHLNIDVQALNCDFYVFSGHKMFGPTGIGVLYGKKHLLDALPPYQLGGEMIKKVSFSGTSYEELPFKFEAGTPNIAGVLGLSAAIDYIQGNQAEIHRQEKQLYRHLLLKMKDVPGIRFWGDMRQSISTASFTHETISSQDIGILLNEQNIAVRVGHHCAMPLMESLGIDGTVRVSLSCYNTLEEIDVFIEALKAACTSVTSPEESGDTTVPSAGAIAEAIKASTSWDEIYRQIMLAGKSLKRLPESQKTELNEVHGCESPVWLTCNIRGKYLELYADSPSKIVRGLLAVIFDALESKPINELASFDVDEYLQELGLAKHLSASRGNGLKAVVSKIQSFTSRLNMFMAQ